MVVETTIDRSLELEADSFERNQELENELIRMGLLKGEAKVIADSYKRFEDAKEDYSRTVAKKFAKVKELSELYTPLEELSLKLASFFGNKEQKQDELEQRIAKKVLYEMVSHAESAISYVSSGHKRIDEKVAEMTSSNITTRRGYDLVVKRVKEDVRMIEHAGNSIEKLTEEYNAACDSNDDILMNEAWERMQKLQDSQDKLREDRDSMVEKGDLFYTRMQGCEMRKKVFKQNRRRLNLIVSKLETQLSAFKDSEELLGYTTSMSGVMSACDYIQRLLDVNTDQELAELRKTILNQPMPDVSSEANGLEKMYNGMSVSNGTDSEAYKAFLERDAMMRKQKL